MVPALPALLAAVLACLTPDPAGSGSSCGPARRPGWATAVAAGRSPSGGPGAVVEALPPFRREEAGEGSGGGEDDDRPARPRGTAPPDAYEPAPGPSRGGASTHPAFHAVTRSRFLLHGRLIC